MKAKFRRFRENWSRHCGETVGWFFQWFMAVLAGLAVPTMVWSLQYDYYTSRHSDLSIGWAGVVLAVFAPFAGCVVYYGLYTLGNTPVLNPFKRDPELSVTMSV